MNRYVTNLASDLCNIWLDKKVPVYVSRGEKSTGLTWIRGSEGLKSLKVKTQLMQIRYAYAYA